MPSDFIDILGKRLRVQRLRQGPAWRLGAPVLVFLHEGLGCIEFWRDFPSRLAEATDLEALVYDRQGYGGSSPLDAPRGPDYLHVEALEYLPAVLRAEGIERAILVGHSDGGSIALIHAAHHPQTLACITEAAHIFVEDITLAGIRDAQRIYRETNLAEKLARYHGDKTDVVFQAWVGTWLSPAFRDWNIEAELPRVRAPVLAMQGEDDEYGTADQVHGIVNGVSGPAEASLIPECGHTPHREQPEKVLATMADFVRRISVDAWAG